MADLTERGQIILISAFILAVTFVALALVVNSAIFTENLASRGEVSGSSEALVYQHQVEQSVGEAMAFANVYNTSGLSDSVKASISDLGTRGGIQQAREGQLVNVSYVSDDQGKRIADNQSSWSTFESVANLDKWNLAENVDETRAFVITTDETSLPSGDRFKVEANESISSVWEMELWQSSSTVHVDVTTAAGDNAQCDVDISGAGTFEIDVTRGVVAGERCHALTRAGEDGDSMWFGAGTSGSYDINFENGDQISGNYSMVIDGGSVNATTVAGTPSTGTPFETDAIYQTTVHYVYVTPNVAYETEVQVAPGEPPS